MAVLAPLPLANYGIRSSEVVKNIGEEMGSNGTSERVPRRIGLPVERKPAWLKAQLPKGEEYERVKAILDRTRLATVCQHARCPNMGECWGCGTATVMLMGSICTRACKFCNVKVGRPEPLDPNEPVHLARAAGELRLKYLVVTSVDRDDLPDGGASHFAKAIVAVRKTSPETIIEVLIPDFGAIESSLKLIAEAGPTVIGHNLETVEKLQPLVRDRRASWRQSLKSLEYFKKDWGGYTKSSLMVGLGEKREELISAFSALRGVGVDVLTLGQYLQPSPGHLEVKRFYTPEEFEELRLRALDLGFLYVAAGPLVRSSYRAAEFLLEKMVRESKTCDAVAE